MSEAYSDHSGAPMPVKWKKGDVHPVTGMVFMQYIPGNPRKERWASREAFDRALKKYEEYHKKYREENRNKFHDYRRQWYQDNREKAKARQKKYYDEHREEYSLASKKRYRERRQEYLAKVKKYREENIEVIKEKEKDFRKRNRPKLREANNKLLKENKLYALGCAIRSNMLYSFKRKGMAKAKRTLEILGCDWDTFMKHIESHFQPGMTWENRGRGGWHFDHHIPLATAKTPEEVEKLCHYTNLRPLWEKDNLSKNKKHPDEFYSTK